MPLLRVTQLLLGTLMLWTRAARHCRSRVARPYSTAPEAPTDPVEYCRELVRRHDYESFLISKFWPAPLQDGYFAIKAFSVRAVQQANPS
jgi:hypothetical protein